MECSIFLKLLIYYFTSDLLKMFLEVYKANLKLLTDKHSCLTFQIRLRGPMCDFMFLSLCSLK